MKNYFKILLLFVLILSFFPKAEAFVVDMKPIAEKSGNEDFSKEKMSIVLSKKEALKQSNQTKKASRLKKRMKKFQKKWERKNAKKRRFFGGATDDIRFKIGLILFAVSLLIGIFARVPLFGGLFGILAGLTGLVGLVLMFLALLEYY